MRVLAIERELPDTPSQAYGFQWQAEARRVWNLYRTGVVREVYFRQDRTTAVMMLECA